MQAQRHGYELQEKQTQPKQGLNPKVLRPNPKKTKKKAKEEEEAEEPMSVDQNKRMTS